MDELRTSWGGVFPPMHRAVIEDGEHKRKREDEHDPSIREGAEGEYGSPQDRALAQRRRRFSKSRARHTPEVKVRGVLEYLRARGASVGRHTQRYTAARQSAEARTALVTRQPYCLKERAAPRALLSRFDKCFAAAWLDADRFAVGTKDNRLVVLDARRPGAPCVEVTLPTRLFEPPRPVRVAARRVSSTPPPLSPGLRGERRMEDATARVRAAAILNAHSALAPPPATTTTTAGRHVRFRGDVDIVEEIMRIRGVGPRPTANGGVGWWQRPGGERHADNCGIHAVAVNPGRTRVATGAANPCDAAVFSLPDLSPTALLTGHGDWVFGLDWVTDNLLASGSRDGTVKLWTVPDEPSGYNRSGGDVRSGTSGTYAQMSADAGDTLVFHHDKVRDLKWCAGSRRLVSVSTDGRVCFSDVERVVTVSEKRIVGKRELVCLATDGSTCAAGSQSHITLFDHRQGGVVRDERLVDNSSDGVRSLSFAGDGRLLTCGGGGGKLTFFDTRAGAFLPAVAPDDVNAGVCFGSPWGATSPSASPPRYSSGSDAEGASVGCRSRRNCLVLDSGSGWLDREHHVFVDHFAQAEVLNACYAHAWDESGTRLLVAGGPLAYGLRGCYVGVWS